MSEKSSKKSGKSCKNGSKFRCEFKVSVIGCGNVGAAAAYAMLIDGTPTELVLLNRTIDKAEGLQLDLEHSMSLYDDYTKIVAADGRDDYAACAGSNLIVITAGARQKEGETRLDLIEKNRAIFREMVPKLATAAPEAILLVVSNPVDVLTYEAWKLSGFPRERVFGSGTMLDSARLQFHIAERMCLSPKSVDAYVLGEHGDTSFPVFSSANVAGKLLTDFDSFTDEMAAECYEDTRQAAYRIINDLGYTSYSIGMVITEIMRNVFQNSRIVLPLSTVLEDFYGVRDVALSVPCVLGSGGIEDVIKVPLDEKEQELLAKSAEVLKGML
jgi:L-lactate dehydrogenase